MRSQFKLLFTSHKASRQLFPRIGLYRKNNLVIIAAVGIVMSIPHAGWAVPTVNTVNEAINTTSTVNVQDSYGQLPLYFIENKGQLDKKVKFYERGAGHSTFFTKEGVYLALSKEQDTEAGSELVRLSLLDFNKNTDIIADGIQEGKVNYLIGYDQNRWNTDISTYGAVIYKEAYKGIDIKYYGNNRQLEYDVIVKPGVDPSKVRFAYEGIKGLKIAEDGSLQIDLKEGNIIQKKPYIYQEIGGKRVEVEGKFKIIKNVQPKAAFAYGFEIAAYNRKYQLVIDPTLVYSTYLGGSDRDHGKAIAVDSVGNAYITGETYSYYGTFPTTPGAYDTTAPGNWNAFVVKLNDTGSALIYATYLGGWAGDYGKSIAVDGAGNAYVTGYTESPDFPTTPGAYDTTHKFADVFVAKLNPTGSSLIYSTRLGGGNSDNSGGIIVDASGNAYVTGTTQSVDFPTTIGAYDNTFSGGDDVFVTKLNPAGSALIYSTFIGGIGGDSARGITVDSSENAYVTGVAASSDFPISTGAYDTSNNGGDSFVVKLNPTGSAIAYSTYIGGSGRVSSKGIAVDAAGNAYVTGDTTSTTFTTTASAYHPTYNGGGSDLFVAKLNIDGSALAYATYLGGSDWDYAEAISIDGSGNAYVTGSTLSSDFPTVSGAYDTIYNGGLTDLFVAKLNATGTALSYSTFIGGGNEDWGYGIAVDNSGNAFVTGYTTSINFPVTSGAYDNARDYFHDAFIAKIATGYILSVTKNGSGTGTISSNPVGIACEVDCSELYDIGATITLTVTPGPGSAFAGWSGDADCLDGIVSMTSDKNCVATFDLPPVPLSVSKIGTGTGTVTSTPTGLNCGSNCSALYSYGAIVTLTATPDPGSIFAGWGGDSDCSDGIVTMDSAKNCIAAFNRGSYSITVTKTGVGSGTVLSCPSGISCGADCSELYPGGTVVTIAAVPSPGSIFSGWSGDPDCTDGLVTVDGNKTCTATFNKQNYSLGIGKRGLGFGIVTSDPTGITCGTDCSQSYAAGTIVILTASPEPGSVFTGWSGNADCTDGMVAMTESKTCYATFDRPRLTTTRTGNGTGTITSNPAGINCGADCSEAYNFDTVVSLTATPNTGSMFTAWTGDPDCTDGVVSMNANKTCTARFDRPILTVTKSISAGGTVTSSPAGITCGTDCTEPYNMDTAVTLTATPATGYSFAGWSGDGDCTEGVVTMGASKTCKAMFTKP